MEWEGLKNDINKLCDMLNKYSSNQIADMCGNVSGRAVRKYANKHGLEYNEETREWVKVNETDDAETKEIKQYKDYRIFYDDERPIVITKQQEEDIYKYYCEFGLTQEETARKVGLDISDFEVVKNELNLVHKSTPFTKEQILELTPEQMIQETLRRKENEYHERLPFEELKTLRREVKKYRQKEYFLERMHELITSYFKEFAATYEGPMIPAHKPNNSKLMLEVPIVDLHYGKLAWEHETGESYDRRIAEKRFMNVIYDVVEQIHGIEFEKIIFPVGNDYFNFDTIDGSTTKGTRQDNDTRWQKMFNKGTELLIKAIDILSQYAPMEVFLIPANHDTQTSFYAIKFLAAWYKDNPNVKVNTSPKTRKYIEFGKNLIGFTHGDKEGKRIFGNMQVEAAEAWGRTKYREWHTGHLHSEQVKEEYGVKVRRLSSVTSKDAWHYEKGYTALATSQSFIWDKEKGLRQILYTNIE